MKDKMFSDCCRFVRDAIDVAKKHDVLSGYTGMALHFGVSMIGDLTDLLDGRRIGEFSVSELQAHGREVHPRILASVAARERDYDNLQLYWKDAFCNYGDVPSAIASKPNRSMPNSDYDTYDSDFVRDFLGLIDEHGSVDLGPMNGGIVYMLEIVREHLTFDADLEFNMKILRRIGSCRVKDSLYFVRSRKKVAPKSDIRPA